MTKLSPQLITTSEGNINLVKVGNGAKVILLLHGYPQNYLMWEKIIHLLAQEFTVIATDLRGYGDSFKPQGKPNHDNYAKRTMARDQVDVMSQLGYEEFYLVGHDRGARVAHRLTLDYPERVKKVALLDIIPTYDLYHNTDQDFATAYYHWFFLIQPYPFPETLINANPDYYLDHCLQSWSRIPQSFTVNAMESYRRCFRNPETIHGTCEDYRAAATIDLEHDQSDRGVKITCPLLVLWGGLGFIGSKYNVIEVWRQRAIQVQGKALNCGHFLPEEQPLATYSALKEFFS
jgi:haloacetate dehalogenase